MEEKTPLNGGHRVGSWRVDRQTALTLTFPFASFSLLWLIKNCKRLLSQRGPLSLAWEFWFLPSLSEVILIINRGKIDELDFIKIRNVCASEDTIKKAKKDRTSLEIQWLRVYTSNAEDMGSIPGPGRFHMPLWATKPPCHNYRAHALGPQLLKAACSRALEPQLMRPWATTTETSAP